MAIYITLECLKAIKGHGEESFPRECCGIMLGTHRRSSKIVTRLARVENARSAEDQHHRFLIHPQDLHAAEREARAQGLDIVGFYHSHPNAEATPSAYDREHAWPVYSYIIVSVKDGAAHETTSWALHDETGQFEEESIHISEDT